MRYIIEDNFAFLAKNTNDIINIINEKQFFKSKNSYFFSNFCNI